MRYFPGCPNWQLLDDRLRALTLGSTDVEIVHQFAAALSWPDPVDTDSGA